MKRGLRRWRAPLRGRLRPSAATVVHLLSLPIGFAGLMYVGRNLWFVGDDWDFLYARGLHHPISGIFVPHAEHWSTIPILIWRAVYSFAGLRHYWPYLMFVIAAHLVVVHLLWRWAQRLGVTPWVATIVASSVILLGVGWENLLWAFQIGFVGSLAFGLGAFLLSDNDDPWWPLWPRTVGTWVLAILSLASSGVGVTMVVLLVVATLLRRGLKSAVIAGVVPTVVYVIWYENYGKSAVVDNSFSITAKTLPQLPDYVLTGLTKALAGWSGLDDGGAILLVAIIGFLATVRWRGKLSSPLAALLTAFVFFAISGLGRIGLGVNEAGSSRYGYVGLVLLLPAIFMIFQRLADRGGLAVPVAASVVLLCVGLSALVTNAAPRVALEQDQERRLRADAALMATGAPFVAPEPLPDQIQGFSSVMYYGDVTRGEAPTGYVSPASAALAHLELQTSVSQSPTPDDADPRAVGAVGVKSMRTSPDCVSLMPTGGVPQLAVRGGTGISSLSLTLPAGGNIGVYDGSAGPLTTTLPAGTSWLRISDAGALVTISLPAGTTQACHLAFS